VQYLVPDEKHELRIAMDADYDPLRVWGAKWVSLKRMSEIEVHKVVDREDQIRTFLGGMCQLSRAAFGSTGDRRIFHGPYLRCAGAAGGAGAVERGGHADRVGPAFVQLPGQSLAYYAGSSLSAIRHADWLGSTRFSTAANGTYLGSIALAPFGEELLWAGPQICFLTL